MVKNKLHITSRMIDIILIALISLIPFIWVAGGYVILGHDAGKPLDPTMHFLDRLNTWTHRYGIGADQTFAMAGFFIHGYEYLLDRFGLSLSMQQGIEYATYFAAIGYAMYACVTRLFPQNRYAALTAAVFYQVNHFTLQGWFIVERTKFTLYIALPLILILIFDVYEKKRTPLRAALLTSLVLFFLNGGGFLPLFGSLLLVIPVASILLFTQSSEKKSFIKRFSLYAIYVAISSFLLQSYWIIPYLFYITHEFSAELTKYGSGSVELWIASISQFASFTNLIRLQGIQEWYVNSEHPYASYFLHNQFLVLISYMLPIAAFGSLLISAGKDRRILLIFAVVALISMLFMAGSHPPLGSLYLLLVKYVPGFIAFRTPFYKFAPGLWLAYAVMIGYTVNYLLTHSRVRLPSMFLSILIAVLIVGYSFPILTPEFFTYGKNRTNHVRVPEYIYTYGRWVIQNPNRFNRVLLLPPHAPGSLATDLTWKYWSLAPINSLLDPGSYIDQNLTLTSQEASLVKTLYSSLTPHTDEWKSIAAKLNIDTVLLHTDARMSKESTLDIKTYRTLAQKHATEKPQIFGPWELYPVAPIQTPIKTATGYYRTDIKRNDYETQIVSRLTQQELPHSITTSIDPPDAHELKIADILFPACNNCLLAEQFIGPNDHNMTNLPGSRFYPLKLWLESYELKTAQNIEEVMRLQTFHTSKRLYEYDNTFVFNLSLPIKKTTLDRYLAKLNILHQTLRSVEQKSPGIHHVDMVDIYNTLAIQRRSLANYIENDYDPDLTDHLNKIYKTTEDIMQTITHWYSFSTDIHTKQYGLTPQSAGIYELFIYTPSVSANAATDADIELISGKTRKTIPIERDTVWQSLGHIEMAQKKINIQMRELEPEDVLSLESNEIASAIRQDELKKQPGSTTRCLKLPLSSLDKEKYQMDMRIHAAADVRIWTFLLDTEVSKTKITRENGQYIRLRKNKPFDISLKMEIPDPTNFAYLICQFDKSAYQPVEIESFAVTRITSPLIQLVRKNPDYLPVKKRNVKMISPETTTRYNIDIEPGEKQFILLDQRFNHNWQLKQQNKTVSNHIKADGYQNAWIIPTSEKKIDATISYAPQRYWYAAATISLTSFFVCTFIYLSPFIKRK